MTTDNIVTPRETTSVHPSAKSRTKPRKAGIQDLNNYERLQRLEKMAYGMTDSSRPIRQSREVAKHAAAIALQSMQQQVELMERQIELIEQSLEAAK